MFCRRPLAAICVTLLGLSLVGGCAAQPDTSRAMGVAQPICISEQVVRLPSGAVVFDLYLPVNEQPAPLVVVAHGFSRSKATMAGWGRRLAEEGFVVAVPTLPAWSDHERNGRSVNELIDWLVTASPQAQRILSARLGVIGFSAGGLSSLLAAADNPAIAMWVGLDPVDRNGLGAAAAARLHGRAVILRAEPSPWNAQGNARDIEQAIGGRGQSILIPGAIHIDPEWPTSWTAELLCGRSDQQRRAAFVEHTVAALRSELMASPRARP